MRTIRRLTAAVVALVALAAAAPGSALDPPPFAEVQSLWTNFWTRMAADDVQGAKGLLATLAYVRFPGSRSLAEWHEVALEMAFCRLEDAPQAAARDAYAYPLHCRQGDETATSVVMVRFEDGRWWLLQP